MVKRGRRKRKENRKTAASRSKRPLGLSLLVVVTGTAISSGVLLGLPLILGGGRSTGAAHIVLVRLGGAIGTKQFAAALRPYVTSPPQRLVIVEPGSGRWPCAAAKAAVALIPALTPGPAGDTPPAGSKVPPAVPGYCPALTRMISHLAGPPVVVGRLPGGQAGGDAGSPRQASARSLLSALYGRSMRVTGGPVVFAAALPLTASFHVARAAAAVFVLALIISGFGALYWIRRGFRLAEPAGRRGTASGGSPARSPASPPPLPVAAAAEVDAGRQHRSVPGSDGQAHHHRLGVRQPARASEKQPPPAKAPQAGDELPASPPEAAVPPVIGEASRTARSAWGLPPEPSPSAIAADSVTLSGLEVRAASIVGPGHRVKRPAVARQDAYRLGQDEAGRYLLIAIADGMSDSRNSDLGANVAATAVVSQLREALAAQGDPARLDAAAMYRAVAQQMVGVARQRGFPADTIRTAILAAVIPVEADRLGRRQVWIAGIADVSAWQRASGDWHQVAGQPKEGLDANVLSEFLPYHPDRAVTTIVELDRQDVLALTTDGVADAFTVVSGAAAWFADRWRDPPPIASFILDVGYEAKTQNDDRTAVVVWCEGPRTDPDQP